MKNIAYEKVVKVIWSDASGNWNNNGNFVFASYYGPIAGTNYEFWNFNTTIGSAGIKQFYIRVRRWRKPNFYDNRKSWLARIPSSSMMLPEPRITTIITAKTTVSIYSKNEWKPVIELHLLIMHSP